MVLLDTHILLWLSAEPERLGTKCYRQIESGLAAGQNSLSAISFWETAMLIAKGRFRLIKPISEWRADLMARGLIEIPVDGLTAAQAGELDWQHGDPADRIIVTTAMRLRLPLMTADRQILEWRGPVELIDARE
jgi:PIN domain nuclease of toxin-antitoxin system